jgi:hypothetical protein
LKSGKYGKFFYRGGDVFGKIGGEVGENLKKIFLNGEKW